MDKREAVLLDRMLPLLFLALYLFGASTAVPAADMSDHDAVAIRAVIAEQLDAFARDDAPRAFALATTGIQAQFGTPERFINMVRSAYPVVYRPRDVQFQKPQTIDGETIQPVRMTDSEGRGWIALYPMQRQADGVWRINGCQLARSSELAT
jgi:hypothetical protein